MLSITLTMALFYSSLPINSLTLSHRAQQQDAEIKTVIYTDAFPAVMFCVENRLQITPIMV